MPKKPKKPKKKDWIDKTFDHFIRIFDEMSMKDYVWLLTYSALVGAAYVTIETILDPIRKILLRPFGMIRLIFELYFEEDDPLKDIEINYYSLAIAMGSAWVIIHTDIDDITQAIGSVRTLLSRNTL